MLLKSLGRTLKRYLEISIRTFANIVAPWCARSWKVLHTQTRCTAGCTNKEIKDSGTNLLFYKLDNINKAIALIGGLNDLIVNKSFSKPPKKLPPTWALWQSRYVTLHIPESGHTHATLRYAIARSALQVWAHLAGIRSEVVLRATLKMVTWGWGEV